MNKKFLSAIMCGAMLTASTSVFVSCEDYGDDIAHLQEQIDQNATTAASELAAKVAALESQLSTLKAAQDNMKEQLASAKAEAAAAANNALSAAQAAQAAADKAQSGAADAKAAADKAQAAADAANKGLSDAVTKVAVLEAKIASLETAIAELSASNKELNTKLNDLQNAYNLLNVNVNANAEEIKAIKADIATKTAELAGQIAAVSSELAGKIDAIDARLKAVEATYAKVAELAALEAKLNEQIAANEAYVAAMEATIAELEAADAAAAALIAANHEEALAKIAAVNEELAAQKAEVAKNFEAVNAQIADLEATVATLAQLATANYNDIAALRQALDETSTDLYDLISQLANTDRALNEQVVAILEALLTLDGKVDANAADVEELISQLAATDRGFQTEFETIWGILDELNTASKDAADQISQLIGADKGFAAQIEALLVDYTTNKELVAEQIINLSKADKDLKDDIVALMGDVEGLYAKLTSAVADLQAVDAKLAEQIKALFAQAEIFGKDIETLKEGIIALQKKDDQIVGMIKVVIADLAGVEKDAADNLAAAVAALEETIADNKDLADEALANLEKALTDKINDNYTDLTGKIADAMKEIEKVNSELNTKYVESIAALQGQIDDINALLNGLHSVVFVPQYKALNFDLSVYHINTYVWNEAQKKAVDGADVFPVGTAKFRVEPAGYAAKLAAAYERDNSFIKLESSDELVTTRAAHSLLNVVSAKADGDFLLVGYTKNGAVADGYYPTALVVSASDTTLSRTSDYFRVKFATEADGNVNNGLLETGKGKGAAYKSYTEGTRNALNELSYAQVNLYHNVFEAYNIKTALRTELFNKDNTQVLPYDGKLASNLRIVSVEGQSLKNGQWSNEFFTVKENGEVSVNSDKDGNAVKNNTKQKITVRVADDAYQLQSDGTDYVLYDVTFAIVENLYENTLTFNYAMTWPATTAAAQEITVATIAADVEGLAKYKLAAADVFNSLFNKVGTAGVTYNKDAYSITMVAVPATQAKEAHIVVTPNVALTQNYLNDVNNWEAASYKDDALCSLININVNFDFSVPGVTDFFNKIKMYWGGEGDNTLEVDYTLKESETNSEYTYEVNMKKVYLFNDWTPATVDYSWSIDKADDVEKYNGAIYFTKAGRLVINGPIYAIYKNGDKKLVDVADLTFTATAANNGNVLAQQKNQKFNVTYPINVDDIQNPNNVVFKYSDLKAGKKFDATSAVSLKDIDGYTWIHDGAIYTTADEDPEIGTSVATAWVIENLKYEVIDVTSAGQDLTAQNLITIASTGGELIINKPANITKRAEVTIKMSFDYKYEKGVATTYTVIVDPAL